MLDKNSINKPSERHKGQKHFCDCLIFKPLKSKEIMYRPFGCGILDNLPILVDLIIAYGSEINSCFNATLFIKSLSHYNCVLLITRTFKYFVLLFHIFEIFTVYH